MVMAVAGAHCVSFCCPYSASPPSTTTTSCLSSSISSIMCKNFPEKAVVVASALAATTNTATTTAAAASSLFVRHRRAFIVLAAVIISFTTLLVSLYLCSRGVRRTVDFWKDLSPLVIRYKLLLFKARYIDKVDNDELQRRIAAFNQDIAPRLATKMLQMGGIFVKIGQMLSTVGSGILDDAFIQALKPLQNGVPARNISEIASIIETATNRKMNDMFIEFDELPIGAASIGQVHRAVLREQPNEQVVVKVQYPEVASLFAVDFDNMQFLTRIINPANLELVQALRRRHELELDFRQEAVNLVEIRNNMHAHDNIEPNLVRIPRVYNETGLCSETVLVLEYLQGTPLSVAIEREQELLAKGLGFDSGAALRESLGQKMRQHFEGGGGGGHHNENNNNGVPQVFSSLRAGGKESSSSSNKLMQAVATGPLAGVAAKVLRSFGIVKEFTEDVLTATKRSLRLLPGIDDNNGNLCDDNMLISTRRNNSKRNHKNRNINLSRAIKTLIHVHGLQLLKDGVFNVDPHPGNVLILPDGRLGLLDYGMVSRLSQDDRHRIAHLVVALSNQNKTQVAQLYTNGGYRAKWKHGPLIDEHEVLNRFASFHLDRIDLSRVTFQNGQSHDILKVLESTIETQIPLWVEQGRRLGGLLIGTASQAARPISLSKEWKSIAQQVVKTSIHQK